MKFKYLYLSIFLLTALGIGFILLKNHQTTSLVKTPSPSALTASPTPKYPKILSYQVPILMYHYIRNAEGESELGKNLSVSPKNFEDQIKWLKENNFESLKASDLADPDKKELSRIAFEKKKPIVITFDDGYEDAYTNALPVLQKYEMTATFYIIRDFVGRPEYMNQTQINKLQSNGFEIGSHTLSHPDLSKADTADTKAQIFDSKENALSFCYPAGKYNPTTVSLVKEAGYLTAVTTNGRIADQNSNLLELPRVRINESSGEAFGRKITTALAN
ncbi:MAG: Polysaccharide deacetylase [Berkelbacteria bacterium GW2011_GWB1_38_5]|uniref:Polysaccharide deacetylase n=2 Tax=Candidatus Berkelbacteria TaxID=1618330 RepID=A0A0G0HYP7_9BACT|nr:MAG: Polysaccharide deacetylase [Berkelbacteria bacterium GW2011_GWA1_36_9]KKQ72432.1 MAG: Polysaccharide deacetylase [Berkelbacteria bacterium GW2011_GWB1_38_5]